MATGGDDCVVRVYQLSKDFKQHEKKLELALATAKVASVDISRDNKLLLIGARDGTCYVCDLT